MKLLFKILFKGFYHFLLNSNQRKFLWLVFRYGDTGRYESKSIQINTFRVNVPDCLSFLWQYKEIFVDESYKFQTKSITPYIVDCGANIGISTLYFKNIFPNAEVVAFEANPKIAVLLEKNIRQNYLSNIEVINKAVWINSDGIELTANQDDSSSIYGTGEKIFVPSIRLRSFLQNNIKKIDLLKIDIEGAEVEVIKDCADQLGNISNIFIEYHSFVGNKQELDEMLSVLSKNNFRFFIKPVNDRSQPFINKTNKNYPQSDLQLNIYAYKTPV